MSLKCSKSSNHEGNGLYSFNVIYILVSPDGDVSDVKQNVSIRDGNML
jgi:hypothetical protein